MYRALQYCLAFVLNSTMLVTVGTTFVRRVTVLIGGIMAIAQSA
jgi:hypothetical protein